MSPSLRGSGLKLMQQMLYNIITEVSLFTREWIEIFRSGHTNLELLSLPLYEGVDWNDYFIEMEFMTFTSPSLRGSGLKCLQVCHICGKNTSPSLRGSGLKWGSGRTGRFSEWVSFFTREWIEIDSCSNVCKIFRVSLFTREWIEILHLEEEGAWFTRLPLYEGVDWNWI